MRIEDVLVRRDGMARWEAEKMVDSAREELLERIEEGETPYDFCREVFGLEPDYLEQLI